MSLTFQVSHNGAVKKVLVLQLAPVLVLVQASSDKFGLAPGVARELHHNGRNIDQLQPVRLAGLYNMAKLNLVATEATSDIKLKIVGDILGQLVTKVATVSPLTHLSELVRMFLPDAYPGKRVQFAVVRSIVKDLSQSIGSVVGPVSSAAIRLNVDEGPRRQSKQESEPRKESTKAVREMASGKVENEPSGAPRENNTSRSKTVELSSEPQRGGIQEQNTQSIELLKAATLTEQPREGLSMADSAPASQILHEEESHTTHQSPQRDVAYLPQEHRVASYENPDQDYTVSVAQAEHYYNMIRALQHKQPQKEHFAPQRYTIRVRFPDRVLLEISIDDGSMKMGQLLKRIDGYVKEDFVGGYRLKCGLPPFKVIDFSFSGNNQPLNLHPDFQQERLVLIWEALGTRRGPYLREGVETRPVDALPPVVLESQRATMPAEKDSGPKHEKKISKFLRLSRH